VSSAIVVGAGIFGGSLAHELVERGWDVTLVDRYPPGHVRAASGGESRLIRCAHGADVWYVRSVRRAWQRWLRLEEETGASLLVPAGVVWFARQESGWEAESERVLAAENVPTERLTPADAASFFPSFDGEGLAFCLLEPEAGVLRARDATRAMVSLARRKGVRFVGGEARARSGGSVDVEGERLDADVVVWACGPWLAGLFPSHVRLRVTRQEVLHFGAPITWETPPVPAWVDYGAAFYGVGDLDGRGVKVSPDREGPEFDPDRDDRTPSAEAEADARGYLARRFPALADAPLVFSRVCPYALTGDTNFLVARHPEEERVWLLGGGSGHGFKHGPALAEYVAGLLEGDAEPDARFGLGERGPGTSLRTAGTAPRVSGL
jgi:glycine/D-amino acid oxidase-like deaminating enzyme